MLASGSVPRTIPGFDVDGRLVLTSDEVLALETAPVVGGGDRRRRHRLRVRLDASPTSGTKVTVLEALPAILTGCDDDVVETVARSFRKRGIDVKTGVSCRATRPIRPARGTVVTYGDGEKLAVDAVSSRSVADRAPRACSLRGPG